MGGTLRLAMGGSSLSVGSGRAPFSIGEALQPGEGVAETLSLVGGRPDKRTTLALFLIPGIRPKRFSGIYPKCIYFHPAYNVTLTVSPDLPTTSKPACSSPSASQHRLIQIPSAVVAVRLQSPGFHPELHSITRRHCPLFLIDIHLSYCETGIETSLVYRLAG